MHERFATENSKERISVGFGVQNRPVQQLQIDLGAFGGDIHPTALAAEIARIQDRDVEERREVFPSAQSAFEFLH
jgi:hypothetical protein